MDVRPKSSSQLPGFAKATDLACFAQELCGVDYVQLPILVPDKELLGDYRKNKIGWEACEERFIELISHRKIESELPKEIVEDGYLLCSENKPYHCHQRLVAGYLNDRRGGLEISHLGLKSEIG